CTPCFAACRGEPGQIYRPAETLSERQLRGDSFAHSSDPLVQSSLPGERGTLPNGPHAHPVAEALLGGERDHGLCLFHHELPLSAATENPCCSQECVGQ